MEIEKFLYELKRNVFLEKCTTFRIGGLAKYFFIAKTEEDLILAIKLAKKFSLPFFILGGGSNLLIADKGFKGLVIKIQNSKLIVKNEGLKIKIFCEAGASLLKLVLKSLQKEVTGLEWAIGIPGTLGGAIYGNAGAFGSCIAEVIKTIRVLEIQNSKFKIKNFSKKECKFGYRESIFKKNKNLVILSAILQLKKEKKEKIKKKIKEYLNYRKKTQPLNFPSIGSVFKNPLSFSAGDLIERTGLKGKRIGKIRISEKHANFIVNLGGGKAKEAVRLINLIKRKVKEKFGIALKEEIQYLGFKN